MTVWKEDKDNESKDNSGVSEINLFESSQQFWDPEFSISPGLYLGMHNMQLYVQENPALKTMLEPSILIKENLPKFPWNPFPAIGIIHFIFIYSILYFFLLNLKLILIRFLLLSFFRKRRK